MPEKIILLDDTCHFERGEDALGPLFGEPPRVMSLWSWLLDLLIAYITMPMITKIIIAVAIIASLFVFRVDRFYSSTKLML